ncbi:hypothetical protein A2U01_0071103, partial [Trifolium medium]|nr:hypothetical protein [Trifolium medium]
SSALHHCLSDILEFLVEIAAVVVGTAVFVGFVLFGFR